MARPDHLRLKPTEAAGSPRDRLAVALRAGVGPDIEALLGLSSGAEREALLRELLAVELAIRVGAGARPSLRDYLDRFPGHHDLVAALFDELVPADAPASFPSAPCEPTETDPLADDDAVTASLDSMDPTEPLSTRDAYLPPGGGDGSPPGVGAGWPSAVGRYRVIGKLGEGGYGLVFLGLDVDLNRRVAVKIPHPDRVGSPSEAESFLAEARLVAGLDHPGIVPVYDFGRTPEGQYYIVSKFIDGRDLGVTLKAGRPTCERAAAIVAALAEALHYAHTRCLVHRDVKARNVIMDRSGKPFLTDFGLALKEEDFGKGRRLAGTPDYMSPEQARGEGHLVDGRSDVFSLGVLFYELLTGVRPFRGGDWRETLDRIKTLEARPPRQLVDSIPRDMECVCLKALGKRLSDRYNTALDMAADLRAALGHPPHGDSVSGAAYPPAFAGATGPADAPSASLSVDVVPRGLRSFGPEDADFFPRMLPGPRDRTGLPESLGFWKSRIEEADADATFRVGLVYGTSGSGKSSLVKAGLLPRLAARVASVCVEAIPHETEARLAAAVRKRVPGLPCDARLPELLAAVRRGGGLARGKLLVVIDQFEQWLLAHPAAEDLELVQALRQCDGARVQGLLIVRDEYWISVSQFLQELDVRLADRENSAAVGLFDVKHSAIILTALGRAFEAVPPSPAELSRDQSAFIEQAVAGLAQDGKVIPVHLSLFAEMVKGRAWTPATLKEVGGAKGVGVAFLEETFSGPAATQRYRVRQHAAREVLKLLLPGRGADIKGRMRPRHELLAASGYADRPRDFEDLERILDAELRLITPVDPYGPDADDPAAAAETHYQLTHDYLVPSLRAWLAAKQGETRRGRAEARLAERAALWEDRREKKQLPSLAEWLVIKAFSRRDRWNGRERAMMRAATRHHLAAASVTLLGLCAAAGLAAEGYGRSRAGALADQLFLAETPRVPAIIGQLGGYRAWADPRLRAEEARARPGSAEALRVGLALLPVDPGQADALCRSVLDADPPGVRIVVAALSGRGAGLADRFWKTLEDVDAGKGRRLRAACVLAALAPADGRWGAVAPDVVSLLTAEDLFSVVHWSDLLRPARDHLTPALRKTFLEKRVDQQGYVAASLLAKYYADDPDKLFDLVLAADPRQLRVLLSKVDARGRSEVSERIDQALTEVAPPGTPQADLDRLAVRHANAALAMTAMGGLADFWPLLRNGEDPRLRTYLVHRTGPFELDPLALVRQIGVEKTPSVRQALVLALGFYGVDVLSEGLRRRLAPKLLDLYRTDPDPGVHSAVDWLLSRWSFGGRVRACDAEFAGRGLRPGFGWFVDRTGHTMAVVPGPTLVQLGSPADEPDRADNETPSTVRIGRTFAISTKEITVRQFHEFSPGHKVDEAKSPEEECPVNSIRWYDAVRYCRWVSEQEGLGREQMCFPPPSEIKGGFVMEPGYLGRAGYRLPTEAEWEAACRAGTLSPRYYGFDPDLLEFYAWAFPYSENRTHPVGLLLPNALGLFDALGNAYERCHEGLGDYPADRGGEVREDAEKPGPIRDDDFRALRGGAFHRTPPDLRSAYRKGARPDDPNERVGFRIVRTLP